MEIEKGPLTFIPPKLSVKLITQYVEITLDWKLFSTGGVLHRGLQNGKKVCTLLIKYRIGANTTAVLIKTAP